MTWWWAIVAALWALAAWDGWRRYVDATDEQHRAEVKELRRKFDELDDRFRRDQLRR